MRRWSVFSYLILTQCKSQEVTNISEYLKLEMKIWSKMRQIHPVG
jgi:hypothetical protein